MSVSVAGIIWGLIYGFIVLRINELMFSSQKILNKIDKKVATRNDQNLIKDELLSAVELITKSYQLATKSLLVSAEKTGLECVYSTFAEFEDPFKKILEKADREVKCLGISLSTINRVV